MSVKTARLRMTTPSVWRLESLRSVFETLFDLLARHWTLKKPEGRDVGMEIAGVSEMAAYQAIEHSRPCPYGAFFVRPDAMAFRRSSIGLAIEIELYGRAGEDRDDMVPLLRRQDSVALLPDPLSSLVDPVEIQSSIAVDSHAQSCAPGVEYRLYPVDTLRSEPQLKRGRAWGD